MVEHYQKQDCIYYWMITSLMSLFQNIYISDNNPSLFENLQKSQAIVCQAVRRKLCQTEGEALSNQWNKPQPRCSHFQLVWPSLLWVPSTNDMTCDYLQMRAFKPTYNYFIFENNAQNCVPKYRNWFSFRHTSASHMTLGIQRRFVSSTFISFILLQASSSPLVHSLLSIREEET